MGQLSDDPGRILTWCAGLGLEYCAYLRTPDAVQVATAILEGCDAFLTNDDRLKRITEIRVIVLGALEG